MCPLAGLGVAIAEAGQGVMVAVAEVARPDGSGLRPLEARKRIGGGV